MNYSKKYINKLLHKTPKLVGKIQSKIDKIDDIVIMRDGSVIHNILKVHKKEMQTTRGKERLVSVNTKEPKTWASLEVFKSWRKRILKARDSVLKEKLSPLQYYVT